MVPNQTRNTTVVDSDGFTPGGDSTAKTRIGGDLDGRWDGDHRRVLGIHYSDREGSRASISAVIRGEIAHHRVTIGERHSTSEVAREARYSAVITGRRFRPVHHSTARSGIIIHIHIGGHSRDHRTLAIKHRHSE